MRKVATPEYMSKNGDTSEDKFSYLRAMNENDLQTVLLSLTPVIMIEAKKNVDNIGDTRKYLIGDKSKIMSLRNGKCMLRVGGGWATI